MAGNDEKRDANFHEISNHQALTNSTENINRNASGTNVVVPIETSDNSAEILLYVDGNQEGVQDFLRVALNQGISTAELQQQLQNAGTNITLQSISDTPTVISLHDVGNLSGGVSGSILQLQQSHHLDSQSNIQSLEKHNSCLNQQTDQNQHLVQMVKDGSLSNLFQLANLSGSVNAELEKDSSAILEDTEETDESSLVIVKDSEVSSSSQDVIEDYIISNSEEKALAKKNLGEFNVGDTFYSLEEVEEALRQYEEKHGVKLYKRDVRSLEALLKRSLKLQKLDKINEGLKYGQLLYCCIYGGKRKAQKLACMDESGISRYTDCKMFIRFAISDDGMTLVVNGKSEVHNHEEVATDEQTIEPVYPSNTGNANDIHLGAGFIDLEELYKAVHKYETDNHVHLWRRDGRTVEALARRAPGTARKILETNPSLRFAELRFCCSHGGRPIDHKSKVPGTPSTFKQGCEMHIRFGVSEDGSQLVVKSMSEEHNHEINEESVVKEALHPELCSFVSKLVWSDVNISIDDVKKQLEAHVCEVMFKDQVPPPRTRRQYFPSKKQIRYFVVKAKASLNISQEAEMKLSAQAERLQEAHGDEKMIFNFKVKHLVNPMDLSAVNPGESATGEGDEEFLKHDIQVDSQGNPEENAKVLFCHQTLHQQRLLKRYSSQVIVTQINDIYSKIPFPLFCLYVQSSVDFQLVGVFILQNGSAEMIVEGLQIIKDWNPGWSPKFVTVDYNECQIAAVESSFPGAFLLISDASREQAWIDWLSQEENEVFEHKDEVMKYLQAIASSYSEDTLNAAARELEESDVWKLSDKMRNWFQLHWLSQAKRWVAGYRPDDYLLTRHTNRCMEDEAKVFKSIKLVNKSSPLQDVIQQIVEHVVPVNKKQYEMLNLESFNMQNELFYLHPGLPNYLSCRPGKLTSHIYERVKLASEHNYVLSFLHPGIFSVQGSNNEDDLLHTVTFGDSTSFPSCDCHDWQQYKLPCVHFCAVFSNYPGWTWDMLTCSYKNASVFTIDWGAVQQDRAREVPGFRSDNSTQTTGSTLLGGPGLTDIGKYSRMSNDTRVIETSQVLATQCRSLLQQISKLQLAHHSRESLYRLKTDLKELLSVFSTGPKHKNVLSSPGLSGSFVVQSRTGKPRKGSISSLNSSQSIFQQYNIKPITPKELVIIKGDTAANNSVSSTPGRAVDGRGGEDEKSVFSVDPSQVLLANAKEISKEMSVVSRSLKRPAVSPASVMSHNLKREKVAEEGDPDEDNNELKSVVLEFPEEDTGEFEDNEQILNPVTTVTTIIDGQTVNIPLDQVSVVMTDLNGDNVEASIVYGDTSHESDVGQITSENNSLEETIVK